MADSSIAACSCGRLDPSLQTDPRGCSPHAWLDVPRHATEKTPPLAHPSLHATRVFGLLQSTPATRRTASKAAKPRKNRPAKGMTWLIACRQDHRIARINRMEFLLPKYLYIPPDVVIPSYFMIRFGRGPSFPHSFSVLGSFIDVAVLQALFPILVISASNRHIAQQVHC